MGITNNRLLKTSFILMVCISIIGVILKVMDNAWTEAFLIVAVLTALIFMATAINEVSSSSKIDRNEKIMWSLGFIFMCGITGLIYLLSGRKRIVANT